MTFPPDDPTLGAKKLHELSFAGMVGDQGPISRAEIDSLTAQLEHLKQQGVDSR